MAVWNSKKNGTQQPTSKKQNDDDIISRINQMVAEENKKIGRYYLEIGKKYVQSHALGYEEEFTELIEELAISQRKLSNYTLQMQFVTGVVVCPECGHKAPKGSVFCNMCGTKLPVIDFDNYEICEKCGNLVAKNERVCPECSAVREQQCADYVQCPKCTEYVGKDNRFCPNCAAPLYGNDSSNSATDNTREKVCPRCNARMGMGMRFCTECGMDLN